MLLLTLRASSSRAVVSNARTFASTAQRATKAPLRASAEVSTPAQLLEKIGRGAEKRLAQHAESWDALSSVWMKGGEGVKDSGLSVRDRRYVLWAFSRYSQGDQPSSFIKPPKKPKTIRGWGPKVQNGIRVR